MMRDDVLYALRAHWTQLQSQFGVRSLILFGSVARGEPNSSSDVDLLVDFSRPTGYFGLHDLQLFLQQVLGRNVDLSTSASLRPEIRRHMEGEAIRVA